MSEVFANDPINLLKWAMVFAVLIFSFIISGKIIKKIGYVLQGQKKRDEAVKNGHVIANAKLIKSRKKYENIRGRYKPNQHYYGTYEYEASGEIRQYHTYFKHKTPPKTVTLYYKNDPLKPFCMEEYTWNPFGGMIYLFFILIPFLLAAFSAIALDIPLYEKSEAEQKERIETGQYEGSLTHNGITVNFKTPEIGTYGGEYEWYTYYTDKEEKTDVKVEFGFAEELPQLPEGSRREDCELWGKEMLYETAYVPFEDEYGNIREQEQLFAYWQLSDDTFFMIAATGVDEELSNAYAQLLNDESFQNSFEISSSVEK